MVHARSARLRSKISAFYAHSALTVQSVYLTVCTYGCGCDSVFVRDWAEKLAIPMRQKAPTGIQAFSFRLSERFEKSLLSDRNDLAVIPDGPIVFCVQ